MKNKNKQKKGFFKPLGALQKQNALCTSLIGFSLLGIISAWLASVWLGLLTTALGLLLIYIAKCPIDQIKTINELKERQKKEQERN